MAARKPNRQARAEAAEQDDNTGLVRVKLDAQVIATRADELASEWIKLEGVEEKKALAVGKFNGEIKLHKQRIHVLAQEVDTGYAYVDPQTTLEFSSSGGKRSARTAANAALVDDEQEEAGA